MTKSLSEQLCKLCGVEPIETPSRTYDSEGNVEMYINYPDFGTPENFVKLLEIAHKNFMFHSLFHTINYTFYSTKPFKEQLLGGIIYLLEKHVYRKKDEKYIKQAIRDTEWKY